MTLNKMAAGAAMIGAVSLAFVAGPARADNIIVNQWYTAQFGDNPVPGGPPSPIFGPGFVADFHGPVLPGGFADAVLAPSGTSWTITLSAPGTLTVTDVETSGDQFQIFINGSPASLATSPFTALGQNAGQEGLAGGFTSNPVASASFGVSDINQALGDANYSSGTFYLPAGVDVITGNFLGVISNGDVNFIVESPAPVPGAGVLGLAGLALAGLYARARAARG
jgi:hypothetical protein